MRVTLLGTGCPIADVHRYGPATLVEAGDQAWLVDCGSGVTQRLLGHGLNGARLTGLLLTHLHSDHTVDFIQLLISGWHQGRQGPLAVHGPARSAKFLGDLLAAWQPEFDQRVAHEKRDPAGLRVAVEEIDGHWRLEREGLIITNTEVAHQPIPQSFGYRFDHEGASVVISGDTAYCPELIGLAEGCDLLVHEVLVHQAYLARRGRSEGADNVRVYHTASDEVGRVAREAGAGALALTHFVPTVFDRAQLAADVRAEYQGPLFIGEDLLSLEVRRGSVALIRSGVQGHP